MFIQRVARGLFFCFLFFFVLCFFYYYCAMALVVVVRGKEKAKKNCWAEGKGVGR
jgi:hypothetical protein